MPEIVISEFMDEAAIHASFTGRDVLYDPKLVDDPPRLAADVRDARALIGRSRFALVDTRPAERNGDTLPSYQANSAPRNVTWTYYYEREDTYQRVDYILLSRGMVREWNVQETCDAG